MLQHLRRHARTAGRALGIMALGAAAIAALPPGTTGSGNLAVATESDGSHTLGNKTASVKVIEYASYTCSHCAHFQKEAELPLRMGYLSKGRVSFTLKHLVRDPIDLTVAMLTNCGDPAQFFRRHNAFMATQDKWLSQAQGFSRSQTDRWSSGPVPGRLRAVAGDFDFYAKVAPFGIDRVTADKCLGDEAMLNRLMAQREKALELGVTGTPGFLINGELLPDVHDWKSLEPQIKSRL